MKALDRLLEILILMIAVSTGVCVATVHAGSLQTDGINELTTDAGVTIEGVLIEDGDSLTFEGSSVDESETTLSVTNPTADRTITVPDASGTIVLNTSPGISITDADSDTGIQVEESADEDKIRFDIAGTEKWVMLGSRLEALNTGESVFIGDDAGINDDLSNNKNVFVGYQSGYSNTVGLVNTFAGYKSGQSNTGGVENTFYGAYSGAANTTASQNTFYGAYSGASNTSSRNAFFGYQSGEANTTGADNSFFGAWSGDLNTTGSSNAFFGRSAGAANTTGSSNAFFGRHTGAANITGLDNAFFGGYAGFYNTVGSDNAFFGRSSGSGNTEGTDNAFFGRSSGGSNTTGSYNTFIGRNSGYSNTTGSSNVFLGYQAGFNESGSNKLYIDNSNTSSPLIYGDFSTDALTINGSMEATGGAVLEAGLTVNDAGADVDMRVEGDNDQNLLYVDAGNDRVGVGTSSPSTKLHVVGSSIVSDNTTIDPDSYLNTVMAGRIADGSSWAATGIAGNSGGDGKSWAIGASPAGALYFGLQNGSEANTMRTHLRFDPNRNTYLNEGGLGNVGIGTSTPSSRLEVSGGDIRVTGGSFIDDGSTIPVADYVFEEGYQLMPLEELGEYVKSEKHLPNVPSAEEIRENGLDLSDFQMRLLEKIEELTLHILNQQERLDKLEEKIARLEEG